MVYDYIGRMSADISVDYRSIVGRLSTDSRPIVGRQSTDSRPMYRPIFRPRPSIVHPQNLLSTSCLFPRCMIIVWNTNNRAFSEETTCSSVPNYGSIPVISFLIFKG